MVKKNINKTNT